MTTIDKATLDKLLEGVDPNNPQAMFTDARLFGQLKKALAERVLQAELSHHLGSSATHPHRPATTKTAAARNRFWLRKAGLRSIFHATATAALNRSWSPNISVGCQALTTR